MDKKLKNIQKAAKVVILILQELKKDIEEETAKTGKNLEEKAIKIMKENNVFSSSYQYNDFPGHICVSVSNTKESVLTHGIPTDFLFQKGDLVSIDVACYYQDEETKTNYHADAALTTIFGNTKETKKENLIKTTKNCLDYVIKQIIPNFTSTQDVGKIIENYIKNRGYYVIKEYGGHGIGHQLHEKPFIPNHRKIEKKDSEIIRPGMFICIEPLVQEKDNKIEKKIINLNNQKTWEIIVSSNGFLNAHFEHTLYINEKEAIILTNYE